MDGTEHLHSKVTAQRVPVRAEAVELPWRPSVLLRSRWWVSEHWWAGRRKLGFWIAGYDPDGEWR